MNNPLMYNDPSVEFLGFIFAGMALFWKAVIIGAFIGLVSYTIGMGVSGNIDNWSIGGALKSVFWGAVGGAVSAGIGNAFSVVADGGKYILSTFAKTPLGAFTQAACHAVSQGALSLMQGGTFQQAFLSAALGSLAASGFGAMAGDWAGKAGGQIFFGAIAGGVGAELTGGNFWQGAVIGGIVAGLNHAMHGSNENDDNGYDETGKKINKNGGDKTDYLYDKSGNIIASTSVEIIEGYSEFNTPNRDAYGKRWVRIGGGGLIDPSFDIASLSFGYTEMKAGLTLFKMGVTNLSKKALGYRVLGEHASKTVLESSQHYYKIYGGSKINLFYGTIRKLPYFTGVKFGYTNQWSSFLGRNSAVFIAPARFGFGANINYSILNGK